MHYAELSNCTVRTTADLRSAEEIQRRIRLLSEAIAVYGSEYGDSPFSRELGAACDMLEWVTGTRPFSQYYSKARALKDLAEQQEKRSKK